MKCVSRVAVLIVAVATTPLPAQEITHPVPTGTARGEVVLASVSKPIFSPQARVANVEGDVIVDVTVRQDGSTDATVVKGHPLLKQAALESAMQSRFECRLCSGPLLYRLVYTFKRSSEGSCCDGMAAPVKVEQEPQSYDEQGALRKSKRAIGILRQ